MGLGSWRRARVPANWRQQMAFVDWEELKRLTHSPTDAMNSQDIETYTQRLQLVDEAVERYWEQKSFS